VVSHQDEIFLLIPRSLLRGGFIEKNLDYLPFILTFAFIIAFTIFILREFSPDKKDLLNIMNVVVLFWTGVVLVIYTYETHMLRKEAQKQIEVAQRQVEETQKQTEIQRRPFVVVEPILRKDDNMLIKFKIRN
jgi:hypothetical protein